MSTLTVSTFISLFECIDMLENRVIWVMSKDFSRTIYISPSYEVLFEKEIAEHYIDPTSVFSVLACQDFRLLINRMENCHKVWPDPNYQDKVSYRVQSKTRGIRWMEDRAFRVVDEFGKCVVHAGIVRPLDHENSQQIENESLVSKQHNARPNIYELLTREVNYMSQSQRLYKSNTNQMRMGHAMMSLTPREAEVLELMKRGKSAKQTAESLSISTKTVEFHIKNLKDKTNSRTKLELLGKLVHS